MNSWINKATFGERFPILGSVKNAYENDPSSPAPPVPEDQPPIADLNVKD